LRAVRYLELAVLMLLSPLALLSPGLRRRWFRSVVRASGVKLVVTGGPLRLPGDRGTLVVANHISWLDIPVLLAVENLGVLGKSDVREWPVLGHLATRAGTVWIDRFRLRLLPGTVADLAANLRAGRHMLVFPEGTTWCGPMRGRFFPATLQAALDAGAPVRPVRLTYRLAGGDPTTVAGFLGDETLWTSLSRVVSTRGLVVEVTVRPGDGLPRTDRKALAKAAADRVF
jgi:1-acyl-sn-glycerol-3-phosphate acyltransferase